MIDWKKLSDPVYQAEMRKEREAREAEEEAKRNQIETAARNVYAEYEQLSPSERSFINTVMSAIHYYKTLSDKQIKWLMDLDAKLKKEDKNQ